MTKRRSFIYYLMMITVVITWGLDPIVNSKFYEYFSASALASLSTFCALILFLVISIKKLRHFNKSYFKIALPICMINSLACILQRIGLQYTTPASYAFLEQLACVVVPFASFIFTKKRPSLTQASASVVCLIGCLIFTGVLESGFSLNAGTLLCASAGILFGVCISATGAFTKELDIGLYMILHMASYFLVSASMATALNFIAPNRVPIEAFKFSFSATLIIPAILFGLFSVGFCWLLKNEATRNINPTAVAIIAPFSPSNEINLDICSLKQSML